MHQKKWWFATLAALAITSNCSVDVPDLYKNSFACKDNKDCAKDFYCSFENTSNNIGVCTPSYNGNNPCESNPCTYPQVCVADSDKNYHCDECRNVGCGTNEICVQSTQEGFSSRCVKKCSSIGTSCTGFDNSPGWCVQVPGYPNINMNSTQPVSACALCDSGCNDCRKIDPVNSYDSAVYCDGDSSEGCRYSGCDNKVCVESRSGTPYCVNACDTNCYGACTIVNRAYNNNGVLQSLGVCTECTPQCNSPLVCLPIGQVDYASDASAYCGTVSSWCSMADSCKDATECLGNICGDGSTCVAKNSCPSGSLCNITNSCQSASCYNDDSPCPSSQYACGVDDMCRYVPNGPWHELNGSGTTGVISNNVTAPQVAIGNNGLVIAWLAQNSSIFIQRWDSTNKIWRYLPGDTTPTAITIGANGEPPALAMTNEGLPVIAWIEQNAYVYLKRWNGNQWVSLVDGTYDSAAGTGLSFRNYSIYTASSVKLAINPTTNQPVVAWVQKDDNAAAVYHVFLRYWSGSSWNEISGSASDPGLSNTDDAKQPALAISNNENIMVAWAFYSSTELHNVIKIYNSLQYNAWQPLGVRSIGGFDAQKPSVAFYGNNEPLIAWEEKGTSSSIIYVDRWDGLNWNSLGFYTTVAYASNPKLTMDINFNPIVVFEAGPPTNPNIHAKRYYQNNWVDIHSSDQTPGISIGSTEISTMPSAAGGNDLCVAWVEGITNTASAKIMLRCHP
ncbi:MAG: hypothetical protein JW841_00265 [Deltaproteobacteria bacterium]|nr:hypothetical protein [Deltaproteobacteria bacterium]